MNFTITEDEYNVIDSTRGQLNLVAGLLTCNGADPTQYNASDLCDFLSAQIDGLKTVLHAVNNRHELAGVSDNVLTATDWKHIIQTISGKCVLRWGEVRELTRKMQRNVLADPDMQGVFDAWAAVLTQDGKLPLQVEPSSTDGFYAGFEVRVPVMPMADGGEALNNKKATPRKREKLAGVKVRATEAA